MAKYWVPDKTLETVLQKHSLQQQTFNDVHAAVDVFRERSMINARFVRTIRGLYRVPPEECVGEYLSFTPHGKEYNSSVTIYEIEMKYVALLLREQVL